MRFARLVSISCSFPEMFLIFVSTPGGRSLIPGFPGLFVTMFLSICCLMCGGSEFLSASTASQRSFLLLSMAAYFFFVRRAAAASSRRLSWSWAEGITDPRKKQWSPYGCLMAGMS